MLRGGARAKTRRTQRLNGFLQREAEIGKKRLRIAEGEDVIADAGTEEIEEKGDRIAERGEASSPIPRRSTGSHDCGEATCVGNGEAALHARLVGRPRWQRAIE